MLNRIALNTCLVAATHRSYESTSEMKSRQIRKIEAIDRLPVDEIKGELLREMSITQITKKEAMEKYEVCSRRCHC